MPFRQPQEKDRGIATIGPPEWPRHLPRYKAQEKATRTAARPVGLPGRSKITNLALKLQSSRALQLSEKLPAQECVAAIAEEQTATQYPEGQPPERTREKAY